VFRFRELAGKSVLELGVGLGIDGSSMAAHGAAYTGVDITQRHLDLAAANFRHQGLTGRFLLGDLTRLGLPARSFDVVYSFGVLHHIEHEEAVVREVARLLKDGGLFMFAVYSRYSFFNFYLLCRWVLSGYFRKCPFHAFQAHLAELSPLDDPVTIKVRSRAAVLSLIAPYFKVLHYDKKGFVQKYVPVVGKYLSPDGRVLNALGRLLGWYHVIIATPRRQDRAALETV
jgi:SAM-dependent methyltransferase